MPREGGAAACLPLLSQGSELVLVLGGLGPVEGGGKRVPIGVVDSFKANAARWLPPQRHGVRGCPAELTGRRGHGCTPVGSSAVLVLGGLPFAAAAGGGGGGSFSSAHASHALPLVASPRGGGGAADVHPSAVLFDGESPARRYTPDPHPHPHPTPGPTPNPHPGPRPRPHPHPNPGESPARHYAVAAPGLAFTSSAHVRAVMPHRTSVAGGEALVIKGRLFERTGAIEVRFGEPRTMLTLLTQLHTISNLSAVHAQCAPTEAALRVGVRARCRRCASPRCCLPSTSSPRSLSPSPRPGRASRWSPRRERCS